MTSSNGRIDICGPKITDLFQMYDKIPVNQCSTFRDPTEGLWDNTLLSKAFFSAENMRIIQNAIRAEVYRKSNNQYIIGDQDGDTLKIIMRSFFLQNAANQPTNIPQQVQSLNKMVLDYSIPQVYSEAIGYHKYLMDASQMYTLIDRPIFSSNSSKQLELKSWF